MWYNNVQKKRKEDGQIDGNVTYEELEKLKEDTGNLESSTYEEYVEGWERTALFLSVSVYAFLIIIGGICIMNLVNTMISSIHTRRRELGMMQAIGMSEKQLVRLLQMEGLFYTAGTLVFSLGLGSLAGYGVFLYAKMNYMLNIRYFHYPVAAVIILAVTLTVIQMLLTYGISRSFRKQTLIERVRYSE